ncbi:MAG TPA: hypothetical protein VF490_05005 [Chryseosolibacter sp.]
MDFLHKISRFIDFGVEICPQWFIFIWLKVGIDSTPPIENRDFDSGVVSQVFDFQFCAKNNPVF